MLRSVTYTLCRLLRRHNGASAVCCVCRNRPIGNPNINQRLHWLRILVREKAVEFGDCAKVDKARIEVGPPLSIVLPAQMPERVDPMRMIEMRVDTENLTKACATVVEERLGKACALAKPIATVSIYTDGRVCTRGSIGGLGRKRFGVVDLASHPPLD